MAAAVAFSAHQGTVRALPSPPADQCVRLDPSWSLGNRRQASSRWSFALIISRWVSQTRAVLSADAVTMRDPSGLMAALPMPRKPMNATLKGAVAATTTIPIVMIVIDYDPISPRAAMSPLRSRERGDLILLIHRPAAR
jgi:hypothetical protein